MKLLDNDGWSNDDLIEYFENVPQEVFQAYAIKGGIEEGCDVDLAFPYIAHTKSVMEIGACYGRVLRHLLNKRYTGQIYAIERSHHFFEILEKLYAKKANLINADIQKYHLPGKVDAILWMWSDIASFPKRDQLSVLRNVSSWLSEDGVFILETISHTLTPTNATYAEGQSYVIESEYGMLYGYIPSEEEIHAYAVSLGFQTIEHIHYFTPTGRERILHIFRNQRI